MIAWIRGEASLEPYGENEAILIYEAGRLHIGGISISISSKKKTKSFTPGRNMKKTKETRCYVEYETKSFFCLCCPSEMDRNPELWCHVSDFVRGFKPEGN